MIRGPASLTWEDVTGMELDVRTLAGDLRAALDRVAVTAADYLTSPGGRRLRRRVAAAMIVTAPLVFRAPGLRRHPLVKFLDVLGGAAAVMELARLIRDWEPDTADRLEAAVATVTTGSAARGGRGLLRGRRGGNGSGPGR